MHLNPWKKIRALEAIVAEHVEQERNLRAAIGHSHTDLKQMKDRKNEVEDQNFHLKMEVERLNARLVNAVFRDPETGRLLPKGQVPA